jgi:homoserine kinase
MPAFKTYRRRFPATSANLGPGFDTAALAFDMWLTVEAEPAAEMVIAATGRDAALCASQKNNLVIETYCSILEAEGVLPPPIAIRMFNDIPLGMGCGSSAAGLFAAITLAVHFGNLGWSDERILEEGCAREGHPDNASACWLGGVVVAATEGRKVHVARFAPPKQWRALVAIPVEPLATSKARALLPQSYSRADVVANLQSATLLGPAFGLGRADLVRVAMRDKIHQPYRAALCPLLPRLLPLAGTSGILGVALSGAGPSVLLVLESENCEREVRSAVENALAGGEEAELRLLQFTGEGAVSGLIPSFSSSK